MKEIICIIYSYAALESGSLFSFLLAFLDFIGTATVSVKESTVSAASIFDPFLCMVESNCLLPARCWDVCVRGGGTQALIEFTINKFLSRGLECSWSAYLLSCFFKDLTMKAASPSKPLLSPLPCHSCSATSVSSQYACQWLPLLILAYGSAEVCLPISLMVIMDGMFAAYLLPSSAHLASHWLCLVNNLTDYLGYFFLPIVPVLISLSQTTLRTLSQNFRISLDWDQLSPDVSQSPDKGQLQSCFEFWILQVSEVGLIRGWSPKPLPSLLFASLFTFRLHSPQGGVKPEHFPNR